MYLEDGSLRFFTQYEKNYTFLLLSGLDHSSTENEHQRKKYYSKDTDNQSIEDTKTNFQYLEINWNQSYSEILHNIVDKFKINQDCSSTITFYLTFPSYPKQDLLSNFFKKFQTISNISSSSVNNNDNLFYRNGIDSSFLTFIDVLPLPIFQELLRQYANVRLVLCGHALGGTVAQLSTLHLLSKEVTLDYVKLRSISLGSLFFAKEETINFIKDHHLEKYFINIHHEMDAIPSLFNIAEMLTKLAIISDQEEATTSKWKIVQFFTFIWLSLTSHQLENHRIHLEHIIVWLCRSLTTQYQTIPQKICEPSVIRTTFDLLKKSINYVKPFLNEKHISKLIYQPIGIFNLITLQKYDQTWHLVNVGNVKALYEYLHQTLERLGGSERMFRSHSISSYVMHLHQCNKQKSSTHIQTLSHLIESFTDKAKPKTENSYSIIIPLPFRFFNHSSIHFRSGESYMSMIAVRPVFPSETSTTLETPFNNLKRKFLSAIKHRTNLAQLGSNIKQEIKNKKPSEMFSTYDICLSVYESYGIDARMELMKLQLDQRMLVPILVSKTDSFPLFFRSYIKTLSLVETSVLQPQENILAMDSKLLRIGFLSTIQGKIGGLPDLIQNIFQVSSLRQHIQGMGIKIKAQTVVETGYGFLPHSNSPLFYQPVILIHIIGEYRSLLSFLAQYVDALIIEYNEDDKNFSPFQYDRVLDSLRIRQLMLWKHTIDAESSEIIALDKPYMANQFEGSVSAVTASFQKHLLDMTLQPNIYLRSKTSFRPRLIDLIKDVELLTDDNIPILNTETLFENVNIAQLRKNDFQLQQSYQKEAENRLQLDDPALQLNTVRIQQLENNIHHERQIRSQIYQNVAKIPILKSYILLISESDDEMRYIQKRQFEFALAEYNEKTLVDLRKKKDLMFGKMNQVRKEIVMVKNNLKRLPELKEKEKQINEDYYKARKDFIDTSLVIEHFWREISHLYVANRLEYQEFPNLAAQHLIDGFPLELIDGDSMLLNLQWIQHVFDALDSKLIDELGRPARILVLSICGPQSSGKSFLLKTMYGIRIRSSVGACTRGINMMLVKVLYEDYDYILLLDTEGLRAPEFSSMPGAEVRDNTLATFAVLPADATILLNKGEINQALEDVLPIVLYLYATSSLSLQLGGQISSKLFFVYNQIDPSQPQKGMELLQDLTTRLHNVTDRIVQVVSTQQIPFYSFQQCRLDLNNLLNSDFRILSTNTNNPPINHPVHLFGEQSLSLRQWINQRVLNLTDDRQWKPQSLQDMAKYFETVSEMIRQAPHIASVSTSLEIWANNRLNNQIEKLKHNISSIYHTIQSEIENEAIIDYINSFETSNRSISSSTEIENRIEQNFKIVLEKMFNYKLEADKEIRKLIKETKREVDHWNDWKSFLEEKDKQSKKNLAAKIDREITNFDFYSKIEEKIRRDFIHQCNQMNCIDLTEEEKKRIFNDILENRITEAQEPYRRILDVSSDIKSIYNKTALIQDYKIFDEKDICYKNGSSKRSLMKNNELKQIPKDQTGIEKENHYHKINNERRKYNEALDQIKSMITDLATSANRYEPVLVTTILQKIYRVIDERQINVIDTTKDLHRASYCYLDHKLNELENKWNANNNRTKRLEERRGELWVFFQKVVEGIRGIKLFESMVYEKLTNSWQDGFIDRLVQDVAADVSKEKWIGNTGILQAYIDNEKLQILKEHGIQTLLQSISSATDFYDKCIKKFVQVHVDKYAREKWKIFYQDVMYVITKAGEETKNNSNDRLNVFIKTLRSSILPSLITSRLPNTVNRTEYGNVDEESNEIFDGVVKILKSAIPEKPLSLLKQNESEMVLNYIQQNAPGDAAKPRCNYACKLCGAPCFRHSGHHGHHDFHHQPAGLAGMHFTKTHFIVHETCHEALMRNRTFSITGDEGPFYSYTKLPNVLGYEVPISGSQRSMLGEYLMSKYHTEIAAYYHIKDNPTVPFAYTEHILEEIEDEIRRKMDAPW
ncbi:unnamed protein product [Rotaria sordida]|uniref:VLIG-type G domain-containing protein n=1 Tax=Rotaria sordida TaxID=392033 RepID=A0A815EEV9_9BILA|nr:unnamed protein product [Rotaria sordida]CAF1482882.1 unnamed protein product [Rotaria sordida]CAF3844452.1 unnamed protein product [Rotaria sordida]CAF4048087.1 unnamed protein product [Rotaria sordida]